jgi:hypothetical protein
MVLALDTCEVYSTQYSMIRNASTGIVLAPVYGSTSTVGTTVHCKGSGTSFVVSFVRPAPRGAPKL